MTLSAVSESVASTVTTAVVFSATLRAAEELNDGAVLSSDGGVTSFTDSV